MWLNVSHRANSPRVVGQNSPRQKWSTTILPRWSLSFHGWPLASSRSISGASSSLLSLNTGVCLLWACRIILQLVRSNHRLSQLHRLIGRRGFSFMQRTGAGLFGLALKDTGAYVGHPMTGPEAMPFATPTPGIAERRTRSTTMRVPHPGEPGAFLLVGTECVERRQCPDVSCKADAADVPSCRCSWHSRPFASPGKEPRRGGSNSQPERHNKREDA